jgi:THO complex subunit 7
VLSEPPTCRPSSAETSIESTKREIEELKVQLEQERVVRQHKEEYEAIARLINELPARQDTENAIAALEGDLSELERDENSLQQKMDLRTKQFHLLLHTVQDLQQMIAAEEAEESQQGAAMEED